MLKVCEPWRYSTGRYWLGRTIWHPRKSYWCAYIALHPWTTWYEAFLEIHPRVLQDLRFESVKEAKRELDKILIRMGYYLC